MIVFSLKSALTSLITEWFVSRRACMVWALTAPAQVEAKDNKDEPKKQKTYVVLCSEYSIWDSEFRTHE